MPRYLWYVPEVFFVLAVAGDRVRTAIASPQCHEAVMSWSRYIQLEHLVCLDIAILFALALWGHRGVLDARVQEHIQRDLVRERILAEVPEMPKNRQRLYRWCLDGAFLFHVLLAYAWSVRCCNLLGLLVIRSAEAGCFNCDDILGSWDVRRLVANHWGICLKLGWAVWLSSLLVGLLPVVVLLRLIRPIWKHLDVRGQELLSAASNRFSNTDRSFSFHSSRFSQQLLEETDEPPNTRPRTPNSWRNWWRRNTF